MPPRRPETSDNDLLGLGLGYGQHGSGRTLGDGHRDPIGLSPLVPPTLPFASGGGGGNSSSGSTGGGSPGSSRRSSVVTGSDAPFRGQTRPFSTSSSIGSDLAPGSNNNNNAPNNVSLSINYLPSKYTQLHEPGQYAHRRGSFFSRTSIADEPIDNKDDSALATRGAPSPIPQSSTGTGSRFSRLLPNKLTSTLAPQLAHKTVPRGGGRQAFASDAGRMGGEEEEGDELLGVPATTATAPDNRSEGLRQRHVPPSAAADANEPLTAGQGVRFAGQSSTSTGSGGKNGKARLVWNRFKWCIFFANLLLLVYAVAILIVALLVWFDVFYRSDVIRVGNRTELIISTTAGALCLFTSLIGFAGIILNNRAFLAIYNLLLWFCFALIVTPGYMTYKQHTFNLEGKINAQWSQTLGLSGRLRVQNQLDCCGYFSPFVEATSSNTCYARSTLPGCKSRYLKFERGVLKKWYIAAFAIVPAHLGIILCALLCANHVTYRFGKGLMPKRYRLDADSMAVIMDEYAGQIAKRYGQDVAQEALHRSTSDLLLKEKGRAYSFTGYAPSIATSDGVQDPTLLGVNTLPLR
ncbi:hypothetical protein QFC22_006536 [Naganishia vaughanmartiniae]|uniref:Uncharacterized protein n=1 Tax=Naganishia vaughanmartiniae TaxID=1424756 RepID=A0ACC2WK95_9TREE|nr:hypothetical protein QFC22_006536 [Naganishia vaughanmartiniae]